MARSSLFGHCNRLITCTPAGECTWTITLSCSSNDVFPLKKKLFFFQTHLFQHLSTDELSTLASCTTRAQRWRIGSTRSTSSPSTSERLSGSNSSRRRKEPKEERQWRTRGAPRTRLWNGTWQAGQSWHNRHVTRRQKANG